MTLSAYLHSWRFGVCHILAITAALAPLLVLLALKQGIVTAQLDDLARSPHNLEIRHLDQGLFDDAWFAAMAARDDVAFVVPRTRFLAATLILRDPEDLGIPSLQVEMTPTAAGDPILEGHALSEPGAPGTFNHIVLSESAARRLQTHPGESVEAVLQRTRNGSPEAVVFPLFIVDVLPADREERDVAFVTLDLLNETEAYREGFAVGTLGADGDSRPSAARTYASFRLYARRVDDVPRLREYFVDQRIDVRTRASEVEEIQRLERNLTTVFVIIASLAVGGAALSVSVSILSNTMRQQRELSVLRLIGLPRSAVTMLPMGQAAISGITAAGLSVAVYTGASVLLNDRFAGTLPGEASVTLITSGDVAIACVATVAVALLSAVGASVWAVTVRIDEGLRDE
ncbi:MAG: ABC transporter permease [Rhodospirillaceae bacterium]|nr:ABC transporter permease [Rhodospirillaceae bacterium]